MSKSHPQCLALILAAVLLNACDAEPSSTAPPKPDSSPATSGKERVEKKAFEITVEAMLRDMVESTPFKGKPALAIKQPTTPTPTAAELLLVTKHIRSALSELDRFVLTTEKQKPGDGTWLRPEYLLSARLSSLMKSRQLEGKPYFRLTLQLDNQEMGMMVWSDEKSIDKP